MNRPSPAATATDAGRQASSARVGPVGGFRPDVEGLRAVAVGLVLLYHAGLDFLPGGFVGVDVFFVISGFLITGLLVKELQRTGTVSIGGFYARRAKRLLPAAAVVLLTTVVLTFAFLPRIRWSDIGGDIVAAALYVVNWRLADRSVDYLAEDSEASPVQHFWSLAVEEQYYLVWPLLLLLAAWWAKRRKQTLRHELWIGLAVIAIPSLAWSIYYTAEDPAVSFFVTTTRMWELAIGAAVALGAAWLTRIPRHMALALGWAGLVAIAVSALIYSKHTPWPGVAAALPTLGTAAVIAAGFAAGPNGPVKLLGTGGFVWIGGLSYSLYLWHWPFIVIATAVLGGLSWVTGLVIVAACVVPSWLTLKFVENPIRHSRTTFKVTANSLKLGAALTAVGVLLGASLLAAAALASTSDGDAAGARVLGDEPSAYQAPKASEKITPDPLEAEEDVPDAYDRGCQVEQKSSEPETCEYGDADGKATVALVGDSKALQWVSGLDEIGNRKGWRVVTYTKSACAFTDAELSYQGDPYTSCTAWNDAVVDQLKQEKPDVVVTSQGAGKALSDGKQSAEAMADGLQRRWQQLLDAGIQVAVLRDNPNPPTDIRPVYECVDEHRDDLGKCAFGRAEGERAGGGDAQVDAVKRVSGAELVDLNDYLCPGEQCPPVIGEALVYRQGSHVTKTYVDSLAGELEAKLTPVVSAAQRR